MSTVTVAKDVLNPASWTTFNDESLMEVLRAHFPKFPDTGRIYLNYVAQNCDVTPHNEAEVEALLQMEGHFYIMVYPKGFEVIAIVIAIVLAAIAIGVSFLFRPNTNPAGNQSSPNNRINNRTNSSRPGERIPDIFGTVRAVPDLIAPDYNVFEGNQEVQYSFLCVGRGGYQVNQTISTSTYNPTAVWDIKEDVTPVQEIAGESVEVYAPNTSPNATLLGVTQPGPTLTLGEPIGKAVYTVQPSNCVNGQILRPPNDQSITGDNPSASNSIRATYAGTIECNDSSVDFTAYFADGDNIALVFTGAVDPGGIQPNQNLSGEYVALTVTSSVITFANPSAVNVNWNNLASFSGAASEYMDPSLSTSGPKWIGPFILTGEQIDEVWCNFVAPSGLFKVSSSSGNQYEIDCNITVGIQAVDGANNPIGAEIFFTATVYGSAVLQSQRGTTLKCVLPLPGSCQVRVMRTNFTDNTWLGTNADQTQWRDLYAVSYPTEADYGNVTTVMTKTFATASALTVKQRKFNMLVTRLVPTKLNLTDAMPTSTNLQPSNNIADIVCAMAKDPFIGNRSDAEIDYVGIYATLGPSQVINYINLYSLGFGQAVGGPVPATVTGDYFISPMIPVTPGDLLQIGVDDAGVSDATAIEFYDSSFAPSIGDVVNFPLAALRQITVPNTPTGANIPAYVRISGTAALVDTQTLVKVATVTGTPCAVDTYFGTDLCTQFGYTFDDSNTSFEEMLGDVAQACFSQFYRQGSLLTVYFEQLADVPTLLFNHRNKLPKSETRTVTFGYVNDYDGIELDYIDPNAPNYPDIDTTVTLYYPTDQSAINAKKITLIGVRNNVQAALIGWRLYQKLLYQNTITKFNATKEATMLVLTNKVIVADNTRDDVMDGQVTAVNALQLTLSQPVNLLPGKSYSIFLQLPDGTVDAIPCTAGTGTNQVILSRAPLAPIICDPTTWVQAATYLLAIPDGDSGAQRTAAFLVTEKKYNDNQTFALTVANYDTRYYAHDQDFATSVLAFNGTNYNGNGGYTGATTGAGNGATFNINTDMETGTDGSGDPITFYNVDSIDVLTGGTLYPGTVAAQLSGSVLGSAMTDAIILTVVGGVITAATDSTPGIQWDYPPTFALL